MQKTSNFIALEYPVKQLQLRTCTFVSRVSSTIVSILWLVSLTKVAITGWIQSWLSFTRTIKIKFPTNCCSLFSSIGIKSTQTQGSDFWYQGSEFSYRYSQKVLFSGDLDLSELNKLNVKFSLTQASVFVYGFDEDQNSCLDSNEAKSAEVYLQVHQVTQQ